MISVKNLINSRKKRYYTPITVLFVTLILILLLTITGIFQEAIWFLYNSFPVQELTTERHIERITKIMQDEYNDEDVVVIPLKSFADACQQSMNKIKYFYVKSGNKIPMVLKEYRNRYYCRFDSGFPIDDELINEDIYVECYENFHFCVMKIDGQYVEINTQQVLSEQYLKDFARICDENREELAYRTFLWYAKHFSFG